MVKGSKATATTRRKLSKALKRFNQTKAGVAQRKRKSKEMKGKTPHNKGVSMSEEQKLELSRHMVSFYKTAKGRAAKKYLSQVCGRESTDESKRKQSEALRELNKESAKKWYKYHPYLAPYEYVQLKERVRSRDRNRCVHCGISDEKHVKEYSEHLTIHHIVPIRYNKSYLNKLCDHESNLITYCKSYHSEVEERNPAGDRLSWKSILLDVKKYFKKFGYKRMLLNVELRR